jgi:hypothetical protein
VRPSLVCAGAVAAVAVIAAGCTETKRPDRTGALRTIPGAYPPRLTVTHPADGVARGYVFLAEKKGGEPGGPVIADNRGRIVWYRQLPPPLEATDFRPQTYHGKRVLTWWQGRIDKAGIGRGEDVVLDSSYRRIAVVHAGDGLEADLHEFQLTPRGTALISAYQEVRRDLSGVGGPKHGWVLDSVVQEIDVATGKVVFQWRALDHVPLSESTQADREPARDATRKRPLDYFHVNSVSDGPNGTLLVSGRNTSAIYDVARDGRVLWRLGGKRSDFELGNGAEFSWQHDARHPNASTITLFDDGDAGWDDGSGDTHTEPQSRGVVLQVDEKRRIARLGRSYRHPHPLLADAMGSFQALPDGHVVIGWGSEPVVSEFSADGRLLADWRVGSKQASYRAYRYPWVGRPTDPPVLAARRTGIHGKSLLFASWNGATMVSHWLVQAGLRRDAVQPLGIARRRGFETVIPLGISGGYVQVTALDAGGRWLANSEAVRL